MRKAFFLDRDGVINKSQLISGIPTPPRSVEEIEILDGVIEAIELLKKHHFVPIVVTNQPDVARGIITLQQVETLNTFIGKHTDIHHFYNCFHDDKDLCSCRKPLTGLIERAVIELNLNLVESCLVGDRWKDIEAGQRLGCRTFFIDYSYPERRPESPFTLVSSLLEAVKIATGVKSAT